MCPTMKDAIDPSHHKSISKRNLEKMGRKHTNINFLSEIKNGKDRKLQTK
jgi:hypothetical protein